MISYLSVLLRVHLGWASDTVVWIRHMNKDNHNATNNIWYKRVFQKKKKKNAGTIPSNNFPAKTKT